MARQAMDSFTIPIDGAPVGVNKGDILPEGDPVLARLDEIAPGSHLFKTLVEPEPPAKAPGRPGRGAGKAAG